MEIICQGGGSLGERGDVTTWASSVLSIVQSVFDNP